MIFEDLIPKIWLYQLISILMMMAFQLISTCDYKTIPMIPQLSYIKLISFIYKQLVMLLGMGEILEKTLRIACFEIGGIT
jgi:hypothetical protein